MCKAVDSPLDIEYEYEYENRSIKTGLYTIKFL
jgi:hypothetical protein